MDGGCNLTLHKKVEFASTALLRGRRHVHEEIELAPPMPKRVKMVSIPISFTTLKLAHINKIKEVTSSSSLREWRRHAHLP